MIFRKWERKKETHNLCTCTTRDVPVRTVEQESGLGWPVMSEEMAANRESVQHISVTAKALSKNIPE